MRICLFASRMPSAEVIDAAVVGDHGQLGGAALSQRPDQVLRDPAEPEAAHRDRRSVRNVGDRVGEGFGDLSARHPAAGWKRATLYPYSSVTSSAKSSSISRSTTS